MKTREKAVIFIVKCSFEFLRLNYATGAHNFHLYFSEGWIINLALAFVQMNSLEIRITFKLMTLLNILSHVSMCVCVSVVNDWMRCSHWLLFHGRNVFSRFFLPSLSPSQKLPTEKKMWSGCVEWIQTLIISLWCYCVRWWKWFIWESFGKCESDEIRNYFNSLLCSFFLASISFYSIFV